MFPAGGAPRNRSAGIAPLSVAKHIQFSNTGAAAQTPKPRNDYIQLPRPPHQTINLSVRPSPLPRPPNPGIATYSSPGRRPRPLICPSDRRRCPDPQTQEWLHTAPQAAGGRPWHVLGRSWPLLGPCWASRGGPQRLQKSSREAIFGGNLEGRFGSSEKLIKQNGDMEVVGFLKHPK